MEHKKQTNLIFKTQRRTQIWSELKMFSTPNSLFITRRFQVSLCRIIANTTISILPKKQSHWVELNSDEKQTTSRFQPLVLRCLWRLGLTMCGFALKILIEDVSVWGMDLNPGHFPSCLYILVPISWVPLYSCSTGCHLGTPQIFRLVG